MFGLLSPFIDLARAEVRRAQRQLLKACLCALGLGLLALTSYGFIMSAAFMALSEVYGPVASCLILAALTLIVALSGLCVVLIRGKSNSGYSANGSQARSAQPPSNVAGTGQSPAPLGAPALLALTALSAFVLSRK
ncbi:phage holin family protein [Pseudovibrio exalbescens]|uniref:phage holin family protein n=1 Tax=Pseudovibrio exalbescens TaxID=197461 RepID=UPI000C99AACA|nr:phage holin family protein [Pseudovibrio exalbescens]